jgi:hypothetical protein
LDSGELRKLAFEGEDAKTGVGGRPIDGGATLTIEGKGVDVIFPRPRRLSRTETILTSTGDRPLDLEPAVFRRSSGCGWRWAWPSPGRAVPGAA